MSITVPYTSICTHEEPKPSFHLPQYDKQTSLLNYYQNDL